MRAKKNYFRCDKFYNSAIKCPATALLLEDENDILRGTIGHHGHICSERPEQCDAEKARTNLKKAAKENPRIKKGKAISDERLPKTDEVAFQMGTNKALHHMMGRCVRPSLLFIILFLGRVQKLLESVMSGSR